MKDEREAFTKMMLEGKEDFLNWRTGSMSVPPSNTIEHVHVAEIGKNMMTLSIKISGKSLGQKTIETTT